MYDRKESGFVIGIIVSEGDFKSLIWTQWKVYDYINDCLIKLFNYLLLIKQLIDLKHVKIEFTNYKATLW